MRARKMSQGMTLIESVLAIVILAIALITLTSFLFPSVQKSALPHYQVRAASLGQAVLNQILAVSFDEQSDRNGSLWRCDELDKQCTLPASLGPDKNEQPAFYNDVDDYNTVVGIPAKKINKEKNTKNFSSYAVDSTKKSKKNK